jgi:2-polyprenyl-3-methyl-5-hydroxy-6-metoxy-1,4-benzoquinol methylase
MDSDDEVRRGYDAAAARYAQWRDQFKNRPHLDRFIDLLSSPATILDVGCGSGRPIDNYLVEHGYDVTGIDVSPKQIAMAKRAVPSARFEVSNLLDLKPGDYDVDGIVSFYAIIHIPRERHGQILKTLASFLRPAGLLLITMGASEWEGREDFHGVEMFWSHYGPEVNLELVENAGFDVVLDEIDEGAHERHQVLIGRKRA